MKGLAYLQALSAFECNDSQYDRSDFLEIWSTVISEFPHGMHMEAHKMDFVDFDIRQHSLFR